MNNLLQPRNWEPACGTERSGASANYMAVLPGVLGCRPLRRTVQVRLGPNPAVPRDGCQARGASACAARGKTIFAVSRQQFMKYPDYYLGIEERDPKSRTYLSVRALAILCKIFNHVTTGRSLLPLVNITNFGLRVP